ncbi:MAG: DNA ligase D, partial [Vicinamibacterales bacterium]
APLADAELVYEPKYDGIRAIAEVSAGGQDIRLWSRLGNEKTQQFPEVVEALAAWARRRTEPVVLDGELVALDAKGEPAGFQKLQGRIQTRAPGSLEGAVAFVLFDALRIGTRDLREQPLTARRVALEKLFARSRSPILRVSEQVAGDGRALYARALQHGWEGLIAKHAASKYRSGKRSPDWRKIKILQEQEFVIGGWTEPRNARIHFGALLLGVYDGARLVYAGNVGTGFDEKELARVMAMLTPLESRTSPFDPSPKSSDRLHWVRPELVAQIKFTEWTDDQHLRHPVYLGLRDDKRARDVVREGTTRLHGSATRRLPGAGTEPAASAAAENKRRSRTSTSVTPARTSTPREARIPATRTAVAQKAPRAATPGKAPTFQPIAGADDLLEQLNALERAKKDGVLTLPDGDTLAVTNLHKVFWPAGKQTKGDLFRYYTTVASVILPVLADRPLVMKRFPNGVNAPPFYQHRAPDVPAGVRSEPVESSEQRSQIIGGDLKTLLYTCQLAAISQDPWFSRVQTPGEPDQVAIDLDPSDDVPFTKVLDVARWVRDELEALGVQAWPKTSGSRGLHIFIPLVPHTPFESALLFCQLVATLVAEKHPKVATVERAVRARGVRVYVDYLQNIEGKTLASAYSVRATAHAGVSTPLTWAEVDAGIRREDFTILSVSERLTSVGDLWAGLRNAPGTDLRQISGA